MKRIRVALLGFGTVGMGVAELMETQKEELKQRLQAELVIEKVLVRDSSKKRECSLSNEVFTTNINEILEDPKIDIVVEVMGGIEMAKEYVERALRSHKHVVTANKDLLALHLKELSALAQENGVGLLFEASVGGAIPVVHSMTSTMVGDQITEIMGIMNGTTNYMLTKMTEAGASFDEVLKEAQELGYAEADPTADVDGLDAGRKLAILASLGFHLEVTSDQVETEGIRKITQKDIQYAKKMGYRVKLLGVAKDSDEVEVRVCPMMIRVDNLLSQVNDSFNAICLKGIGFGASLLYGRGAGSLPTGSAVLGDVMKIAGSIVKDVPMSPLFFEYRKKNIASSDKLKSKVFLRLQKSDSLREWSILEEELKCENGTVLMHEEDCDEWIVVLRMMEGTRDRVLQRWEQEGKIMGCNSMIRMEGE